MRSVDVMASLDPLEWWKMHNTQFPTIAAMEPTSPTAGGINYAKAQCMDASKEISYHVYMTWYETSYSPNFSKSVLKNSCP